MKNKQFKTEQLSTQNFSANKVRSKAIKISVLSSLPVQKFNVLLKSLLPHTHLTVYQKIYKQWD